MSSKQSFEGKCKGNCVAPFFGHGHLKRTSLRCLSMLSCLMCFRRFKGHQQRSIPVIALRTTGITCVLTTREGVPPRKLFEDTRKRSEVDGPMGTERLHHGSGWRLAGVAVMTVRLSQRSSRMHHRYCTASWECPHSQAKRRCDRGRISSARSWCPGREIDA